jgi:hypothetical protein
MTAAAFQSLGISHGTTERLNRLVIGVATIAADIFRKRGSRKMVIEMFDSRVFIGSDSVS